MIERVVNYEDIYLEEAKLELAEEFVCLHEDLDRLDEEARQAFVVQIAKMITAAEVFVFDGPVGTNQISNALYELEDGTQKAIIVAAEKTEEGVRHDVIWVTSQELMQNGFTYDHIRNMGFSMLTDPGPDTAEDI